MFTYICLHIYDNNSYPKLIKLEIRYKNLSK